MNAYRLLKEDGTETGLWGCSACGQISTDKPYMDTHCLCPECGAQYDPKKFRCRDWRCEPCDKAYWTRRESERMAKAEKLDAWDGWVYDGSRYHESLDDYIEHLECNIEDPTDWPEFVYTAEPEPFSGIDLDRVMESAADGWDWDDFDYESDLNGVADLRAAINAFNAANKDVVAYYADESKAVRVPRPVNAEAQS